MSDVDNLYKAPEKLDDISTGIEGAPGVNPKTRMFIGQSAPWLKFLGVMGYIGAGVMVLYAIVAFVTPLSLLGYGSNDSGGIGAILALVYLGAAVVMFFSARFMYVMGRSANSFKLLGQAPHLEDLAFNLKRWSSFNGIVTIAVIGLCVLAIIGAIVFSMTRYL